MADVGLYTHSRSDLLNSGIQTESGTESTKEVRHRGGIENETGIIGAVTTTECELPTFIKRRLGLAISCIQAPNFIYTKDSRLAYAPNFQTRISDWDQGLDLEQDRSCTSGSPILQIIVTHTLTHNARTHSTYIQLNVIKHITRMQRQGQPSELANEIMNSNRYRVRVHPTGNLIIGQDVQVRARELIMGRRVCRFDVDMRLR
ncbi:hypothetical protein EVAR_97115_1 [Eumeta japonica]|uniref:Uncharacterized protein n=1 Tax=Eumeta variegata TaxID=151549 RepID=A0A4C1WP98_EUMVA|nr:hypothetical protein EVAR_97115_1 [Eumeta japonica]